MKLPFPKFALLLIGALSSPLLLFCTVLSANQDIISTDGREILLKDDGTWQYRSTDRLIDTPDGHRVRLKEDGSWQYEGNAALTTDEQVRTTDLDIKLQQVVIEKREKKGIKNKRIKTQTVFYLNLSYSAQADKILHLRKQDISLFEVSDDNGTLYPVLSVQPESAALKPGSGITVTIRADKSPGLWDDAKSMQITLKPDIFDLQTEVSFSQNIDDFEEENVDEFANEK